MSLLKKAVPWLVIALIAFYLISNPTEAASTVRGIGAFIGDAFTAIISFLESVFQ